MKRLIILLFAAAAAVPGTSRASPSKPEVLAATAMLSQIAPMCGMRSAQWGLDLLEGTASLIQSDLPHNPLDSGFLAKLTKYEAFTGAAYLYGGYAATDWGRQNCKTLVSPHQLANADIIVHGFKTGDRKEAVDPHIPADIPNRAVSIAWRDSIAVIALHCGIRTKAWGQKELPAVYGAAAQAAGSSEHDQIAATAAIKLANDIGDLEYRSLGQRSCAMARNSAEIKQIDTMVQKAPTDPWAGVKP